MQGYVQHVFEDVEYLFDKGVVIPDKDVAIPHISTDGDALIFRRGGLLVWYHADFSRGYSPLSAYYTTGIFTTCFISSDF